MLPSVLLVLDQGSSWATWSRTAELKSTPTKLRQLTICNHLGILRRFKGLQDDNCSKLIHLSVSRQMQTFLLVIE